MREGPQILTPTPGERERDVVCAQGVHREYLPNLRTAERAARTLVVYGCPDCRRDWERAEQEIAAELARTDPHANDRRSGDVLTEGIARDMDRLRGRHARPGGA